MCSSMETCTYTSQIKLFTIVTNYTCKETNIKEILRYFRFKLSERLSSSEFDGMSFHRVAPLQEKLFFKDSVKCLGTKSL